MQNERGSHVPAEHWAQQTDDDNIVETGRVAPGLYHQFSLGVDFSELFQIIADIIASGPVQGASHAIITVGCLRLCLGKRDGKGKRPSAAKPDEAQESMMEGASWRMDIPCQGSPALMVRSSYAVHDPVPALATDCSKHR